MNKIKKKFKQTGKKVCPSFSAENMEITFLSNSTEIISLTATNKNVSDDFPSSPRGTSLRIDCIKGFESNLPGKKKRVKCKRGNWRPVEPKCSPSTCQLPVLREGGRFLVLKTEQNSTRKGEINHGQKVKIQCDSGFKMIGDEVMECQFGAWIHRGERISGCQGLTCKLPAIPGQGTYSSPLGDYSAGETIDHNQKIDFKCTQMKNFPSEMICRSGRLFPANPECFSASKRVDDIFGNKKRGTMNGIPDSSAALEIAGSPSLVSNGDLIGIWKKVSDSNQEEKTSPVFRDIGTTSTRLTKALSSCIQPDISGVQKGIMEFPVERTLHPPLKLPITILGETMKTHDGKSIKSSEFRYPHGTAVKFDCVPPSDQSENFDSWKIECRDGRWIGEMGTSELGGCHNEGDQSLKREGGGSEDAGSRGHTRFRTHPFNSSCEYKTFPEDETNLVVYHQDVKLSEENTSFIRYLPPGAELTFRCRDIGKFQLHGSGSRRCIGGMWDGNQPVCKGLNQMYEYDENMPPTILIRFLNGRISQSNDGQLVVTPGTIVHLECLWSRKLSGGHPKWDIDNYSGRTYPQGWTTEPGRDSQLEYRLSIYHARANDTGSYTCTTPKRRSHKISVDVKDVRCSEIKLANGIKSNPDIIDDLGLNAEYEFECKNGNELDGPRSVKCLPSGEWSDRIPTCERQKCSEELFLKAKENNVMVNVQSLSVGSKVVFKCVPGFKMAPGDPDSSICKPDGKWSGIIGEGREARFEVIFKTEFI